MTTTTAEAPAAIAHAEALVLLKDAIAHRRADAPPIESQLLPLLPRLAAILAGPADQVTNALGGSNYQSLPPQLRARRLVSKANTRIRDGKAAIPATGPRNPASSTSRTTTSTRTGTLTRAARVEAEPRLRAQAEATPRREFSEFPAGARYVVPCSADCGSWTAAPSSFRPVVRFCPKHRRRAA